MLYLPLIGLCALTARVAAQTSCNATTVVTVTPAPVTEYDSDDVDVYYTTSAVTRFALTTSVPAAAAERKVRQARQPKHGKSSCPKPTATVTTTLAPSTIHTTATYTFSEVARATAIVPACQASNNYGLLNQTLEINGRVQHQIATIETTKDSCAEECCMACFTYSNSGCLSWSFNGSPDQNGDFYSGCALQVLTLGCPMYGLEVIAFPNSVPEIGVGPCLLEVQTFIQG